MREDAPKYPIFNPFKRYYTLQIPEGVARYRGLSPGAKVVYGRLYRYAGQKGVAFPAVETLAEEVGLGTRQTQTYIAELQAEDFIHVKRQYRKGAIFEFEDHPALSKGEVGISRWGNPDGVKPQDTAESLFVVGPQYTAEPSTAVYCGLTAPLSLLNEEGHFEEGHLSPEGSLDISELLKNLGSRFKNLKGSGGFQKALRDLLETRLSKLSDLSTEHVYRAFDSFTGESFWSDYDGRHRVNAFFSYLDKGDWNHKPLHAAAQDGRLAPAAPLEVPNRHPQPTEAPQVKSEPFPDIWNRLVPAAPVEWNDRMDGKLLETAIRDEAFTPRFEEICQKAQAILVADPDADWKPSLRWALRYKDGAPNWWKLVNGEIRPKKAHPAAKSNTPAADTDRWIANMKREREEKKSHEAHT